MCVNLRSMDKKDFVLSLLSRGYGQLVHTEENDLGGRIEVCFEPEDYFNWKSQQPLLYLPPNGQYWIRGEPAPPKTYSTRRGPLVLYSEDLALSSLQQNEISTKKILPQCSQQAAELRVRTLRDLTVAALAYGKKQPPRSYGSRDAPSFLLPTSDLLSSKPSKPLQPRSNTWHSLKRSWLLKKMSSDPDAELSPDVTPTQGPDQPRQDVAVFSSSQYCQTPSVLLSNRETTSLDGKESQPDFAEIELTQKVDVENDKRSQTLKTVNLKIAVGTPRAFMSPVPERDHTLSEETSGNSQGPDKAQMAHRVIGCPGYIGAGGICSTARPSVVKECPCPLRTTCLDYSCDCSPTSHVTYYGGHLGGAPAKVRLKKADPHDRQEEDSPEPALCATHLPPLPTGPLVGLCPVGEEPDTMAHRVIGCPGFIGAGGICSTARPSVDKESPCPLRTTCLDYSCNCSPTSHATYYGGHLGGAPTKVRLKKADPHDRQEEDSPEPALSATHLPPLPTGPLVGLSPVGGDPDTLKSDGVMKREMRVPDASWTVPAHPQLENHVNKKLRLKPLDTARGEQNNSKKTKRSCVAFGLDVDQVYTEGEAGQTDGKAANILHSSRIDPDCFGTSTYQGTAPRYSLCPLPADEAQSLHVLPPLAGHRGPGKQSSMALPKHSRNDPNGEVVRGTLPAVLREWVKSGERGTLIMAPNDEVIRLSIWDPASDIKEQSHVSQEQEFDVLASETLDNPCSTLLQSDTDGAGPNHHTISLSRASHRRQLEQRIICEHEGQKTIYNHGVPLEEQRQKIILSHDHLHKIMAAQNYPLDDQTQRNITFHDHSLKEWEQKIVSGQASEEEKQSFLSAYRAYLLNEHQQKIIATHGNPFTEQQQMTFNVHGQPFTEQHQKIFTRHGQPFNEQQQKIIAAHGYPFNEQHQMIFTPHSQPFNGQKPVIYTAHGQTLTEQQLKILTAHGQPLYEQQTFFTNHGQSLNALEHIVLAHGQSFNEQQKVVAAQGYPFNEQMIFNAPGDPFNEQQQVIANECPFTEHQQMVFNSHGQAFYKQQMIFTGYGQPFNEQVIFNAYGEPFNIQEQNIVTSHSQPVDGQGNMLFAGFGPRFNTQGQILFSSQGQPFFDQERMIFATHGEPLNEEEKIFGATSYLTSVHTGYPTTQAELSMSYNTYTSVSVPHEEEKGATEEDANGTLCDSMESSSVESIYPGLPQLNMNENTVLGHNTRASKQSRTITRTPFSGWAVESDYRDTADVHAKVTEDEDAGTVRSKNGVKKEGSKGKAANQKKRKTKSEKSEKTLGSETGMVANKSKKKVKGRAEFVVGKPRKMLENDKEAQGPQSKKGQVPTIKGKTDSGDVQEDERRDSTVTADSTDDKNSTEEEEGGGSDSPNLHHSVGEEFPSDLGTDRPVSPEDLLLYQEVLTSHDHLQNTSHAMATKHQENHLGCEISTDVERSSAEPAAQKEQQRERAERRRLEVERKRKEREEEKRRQLEREQREEHMRLELQVEQQKRAEEFRVKRLKEQEDRQRKEEEEREQVKREQAEREMEKRRQEEEKRQLQRFLRARQEEQERRAAESARQRAEEEARQELERRMLQEMEEDEQREYLRRKQEEEEEKRRAEYERKRREEEETRQAIAQARLQAEIFARQRAALEQKLQFRRGLQAESEVLGVTQEISRPWVYSYFSLMEALGLPLIPTPSPELDNKNTP